MAVQGALGTASASAVKISRMASGWLKCTSAGKPGTRSVNALPKRTAHSWTNAVGRSQRCSACTIGVLRGPGGRHLGTTACSFSIPIASVVIDVLL